MSKFQFKRYQIADFFFPKRYEIQQAYHADTFEGGFFSPTMILFNFGALACTSSASLDREVGNYNDFITDNN